ncbi:hypothetical protein [Pseudactinotalea sp. HY158]|uniref:hypothetical protein n=1 Tax=Pseudactinotalea sp. HY158 TaxID=2654547 RepID=UPI001E4B7A39|nr:hypothetical protein [Pseudactinotalea sp. HY158]
MHDADWTYRGDYMLARHGVTPAEANESMADPGAVTFIPDPASASGQSIRIIGRARSTGRVLTVIVLDRNGVRFGVNGWPANATDQRRYATGGDPP